MCVIAVLAKRVMVVQCAVATVFYHSRTLLIMGGCRMTGCQMDGRCTHDVHVMACRYCDAAGTSTESYPFNPNGSPEGIAALTSPCGRHLALMPHPERCFLAWQNPWCESVASTLALSGPPLDWQSLS